MALGFSTNQFAQSPVVGMQDLDTVKGTVISGILDPSYVGGNVAAGTFLKLIPTSSGIPKVTPITSDSDTIFGVALYSVKNGYYNNTINDGAMEIGQRDTAVYMNSGGAINAGGSVTSVAATPGNVIAAGSGARIGYALDAATGPNQLIRVVLDAPSAAMGGGVTSRTATVTATLAQINAGLVAIPGIAGKAITVTNFIERVLGTFASGTSVDLRSDATGVIVESTAEAGLTNGAVLIPGSANVTLGAGYGAPLPVGEGVKIVNVGTAQTGGTSITFDITYTQA